MRWYKSFIMGDMDTKETHKELHPEGEGKLAERSDSVPSVLVETYGGRVHVEWDPHAAVTPLGQLPFFIDFLKTAEMFEPWVRDCPLEYRSNNAPKKVDVLGTLMLSVLAGQRRYAHIDTVRCDTVNPPLLGMSKVVSSSSARRSFRSTEEGACVQWLQCHLQRCYEQLLYEPWILDVDTQVKVLYGHQEGAVVGYNPKKRGRPSHVLHTYFMANTRLVLDVEVRPGNETAAKYTMPGLWAFLDRVPRGGWPNFIRGDCTFGNERDMRDAEARCIPYLFKLRQTSKVKALIEQLFSRTDWMKAGGGWEGIESQLRLMGWTKSRRVIVLRRRIKGDVAFTEPAQPELGDQQMFAFVESEVEIVKYEYAVLVTSLKDEIMAVAQHYRDRADCENIYDEETNQWGWGGYTTQDMKRCQVMARIIALVYNWWSLFVRLAIPERHAEAITSRPLLLYGVGTQTRHGRQKTITITSAHAEAQSIQRVLTSITNFLSELKATARQLSWKQRWRIILSRIFIKFLKGRPLADPDLLPVPI